jgi:hypothetical protein
MARRPQNFSGWNIAHPRYTSRNTATIPEMMYSNIVIPYARSHAFVMAQSARKPTAPIAT